MATTEGDDSSGDERPSDGRRRAVITAALKLFAERGYENTTADAIAEAAGVSRRTFFYYFPSKADVLFSIDPESLTRLTAEVAAQPTELDDLEAIERSWLTLQEWSADASGDQLRQRVVQLLAAASSSSVLRGRQYQAHLAYEEALAAGLARRQGRRRPDLSMQMAAALGQTIMGFAMTEWVRSPRTSRRAAVERAFTLARATIADDPDRH